MPEFITEKIDESHDRWRLRFASTTLQQKGARVVPEEIPATHELQTRWNIWHPKCPPELVIELVRKEEPVASAIKTATIAISGDPISSIKTDAEASDQAAKDAKFIDKVVDYAEKHACDPAAVKLLEKLSEKDLETEAGVKGVSLYLNGGTTGKKCTRAQLIARLAGK